MTMFFKLDGITGDATSAGHLGADGWTLIQGLSFGATSTYVPGSGGQPAKGTAPAPTALSIAKSFSSASTDYYTACTQRRILASATVDICATADDADYLIRYTFGDVIVTSYQSACSGEESPFEQLTFSYASTEIDSKLIDPNSGQPANKMVMYSFS